MKIRNDKSVGELLRTTIDDQDRHCLTAYFPFNGYPKKEYSYKFSSFIKEGLRAKNEVEKYSKAHDRILKAIDDHLHEIGEVEEGVAVFVEFDPESLEKRDKVSDKEMDIMVMPLWVKPEKEIFIGNVYDLDQLLDTLQNDTPALVISVDRQKAKIFTLKRGIFEKLEELKNPFAIKKEPGEYISKHKPTRDDQAVFGTGTSNMQNREDEEERRFLNEIVRFIKENKDVITPVEMVIIYYSKKFEKPDELEDEIHDIFSPKAVISEDTVFQDEDELQGAAREETFNYKNEEKDNEFYTAKEQFDLYSEDWEEIAEASRQGRIDTLFKKNGIIKKGYIGAENMVYINETDGAIMVENIAPWLVRSVLASGGQILLYGNDNEEVEVAAKFRFNP